MKKTAKADAWVLGLGESGEGAARLLAGEGWRVTVLDQQDRSALRDRADRLEAAGVQVLCGSVADLPEGAPDLCVVSPGLPLAAPWLVECRRRKVTVLPEFELGWSRHRGRTLAVTGTNGKSTIVKWLAEALAAAGVRAEPAGNYGPSVCAVVQAQPDLDWLVLEVSSFQLEAAQDFRADAGLMLNIVPNHLDRHGTFEAYETAKARLFARTQGDDLCIAPESQARHLQALSGGRGQWLTFGTTSAAQYVYQRGLVRSRGHTLANLENTYFHNDVLGVNAAGGIAALHGLGVDLGAAERAARAFKPLSHRMESLGEKNGVRFVNDSKATTLTAMAAGAAMCGGPVRLIAGGLLKEDDLSLADGALRAHVSGVYLIGKAAPVMAEAWSSIVPCRSCGQLAAALKAAWADARPGDVILLSPGCASFDQYASFRARGEEFRSLVKKLTGE